LARAATTRLTIEPLATTGDLSGSLAVVHNDELVTRHGHAAETEYLNRNRRARLGYRTPALVEECAYTSRMKANDEVIANLQCAALHEHRCNRSLSGVELRFNHNTIGVAISIRLQVQDFRLEQYLLQELVNVRALLCRDFRGQRLAAELLQHNTVLQQFLLHLLHVRTRKIDLVDGHDDRH